MLIALGQINTIVGDMDHNVSRMLASAEEAAARGARLIVFPELSICGYPPRDLVQSNGFVDDNRAALMELARQLPPGLAAVTGYVARADVRKGRSLTNSLAVVEEGRLLHEQAKVLLPTYDVFDEHRHFESGKRPSVFEFSGLRIGLTVCEDVWNDKYFWKRQLYSRDPVLELVKQKPDFLINISASPYAYGKPAFRVEMLGAIARRHSVPVVFTNAVGGNDSLVFDGSSFALDSKGALRTRAKPFEEHTTLFDSSMGSTDIHPQPASETEMVFMALTVGTRDYCRKCGFDRAVIGLSGGIDSALTAVVATHALGAENVIGVAMPGPYSSEGSVRDARQLAENLGIRFETIPIGGIYDETLRQLVPVFGDRAPDVTEENMQARARGLVLMSISNKFGALVLTTGNKSELAVGYCTLYGDMVGGLAVIADVYKTLVYELARWINRSSEVIPAPTIEKPPSAELRPDQKDQDTLPPYDILDQVLKDYVEDRCTPEEIVERRGYSREMVQDVVRMVNRNEYKRQQAAPNIKVTPKAFGVGRVFPIAQRYRR